MTTAPDAPPKLVEIAKRIAAHLRRFESDPVINVATEGCRRPYYNSGATVAGSRVAVWTVSFQHATNLTRADALRYLAWLDAGNVGSHYASLEREP